MIAPHQDASSSGARAADIRPIVAHGPSRAPVWLFSGGVVLGAILLFTVLDANRRAFTAPATQRAAADGVQLGAPLPPLVILPELYSPPPPPPPTAGFGSVAPFAPQPIPQPVPAGRPPVPAQYGPQPPPPGYSPPPMFVPAQAAPQPQTSTSSASALVIDTTTGRQAPATEPSQAGGETAGQGGRATSTRIGRRANTVAQGTLIPAVLETALDSTRPGFVRAIVSRDVTGFDGRQVLIPRGSRLFGEYQADLAAGQNRAFVLWTRLVRPDGVTIVLSSPAADLQGRIGIRGQVDNHFLERFGSALVQTTLSVGANLAGRSIAGDSGVVVALPGAVQNGTEAGSRTQIQPTLRVAAGARVSVFVARDLELPARTERR